MKLKQKQAFFVLSLILIVRTSLTRRGPKLKHTADATQLSSWVASAVCKLCIYTTQFATRWRQSRRVYEQICQQQSRIASCQRCERTRRQSWPSFCAVKLLRLVTSDDIIMTLLLKKSYQYLSKCKMLVVKPLCSVSKLSTESVGSRHELVAMCSHRRRSGSRRRRCVLGINRFRTRQQHNLTLHCNDGFVREFC